MMGFGFGEVLVLALLTGAQTNSDLVAFIPPQHYFQSRQIEVSIDKMMDLANSDPKDPKTQIMQLTALRYLADEAGQLKKASNYAAHRQTLEQIADGKKAQDSLGFAKEYAHRVLAKLDGTKLPARKAPLLREDAAAWFPADSSLLLAFDLGQVSAAEAGKDPLHDLIKMIPDEVKNEMYTGVEKFGNIRLERFALALAGADKENDRLKIMMRFTGKANPVWLTAAANVLSGNRYQMKEINEVKGLEIRTMQPPERAPIIATVGTTDLVIVGYKKDSGKHEELLQEILAVRAKKQPSAATGALKQPLAKLPAKSVALLIGNLTPEMKSEVRFLNPAPTKVFAYIERAPQGLDVTLETTMANADDAGKLVNQVGALRKEGIQGLQQAQKQPLPPGLPPIPFGALLNVLESLQVQNQDERVTMRVLVPDSLVQQLGTMSSLMFSVRGQAPARPIVAPPPAPKQK